MTIINRTQPTKLAFGSYKSIGIPKFAKSAAGSKSIWAAGPQMMSINMNVKPAVRQAATRHMRSSWRQCEAVFTRIDGANQPVMNPNRIAKIGTPIPAPTAKRSRKTKTTKGTRNSRESKVDIW